MPIVSSCPKCGGAITVPDGVPLDAEVRCPLCGAGYVLRDAMPSLPPALIVVGAGAGDEGPIAAAPSAEALGSAAAEPSSELSVKATSGATEAAADRAVGEAAGQPAAAKESSADDINALMEATGLGAVESSGEKPSGLAVWEKVDGVPELDLGGEPAEAGEGAEGGAVDLSVFAGFAREDDESEAAAPTKPGMPRRPGRKRKEKNVAKEIVGAIVGGFLGLTIGYYLLNLIGGERFDFMGVWLPFISHTAKHWPSADETAPEKPEPSGKPSSTAPRSPRSDLRRQDAATQPAATDLGAALRDLGHVEDGAGLSPEPLDERGPGFDPMGEHLLGPQLPVPETPVPEPPAATPEPVGPRNAPKFTPAQLAAALKAAHASIGCPTCNSTGAVFEGGQRVVCDACKGVPDLEMTPEAYEALRALGEALALVDESDPAAVTDRRLAAETLVERLAKHPGQDEQIGRFAAAVLQANDKASGGILLAGTAGQPSSRGDLHGVSVELAGIPTVVTVFSRLPLSVSAGERIAVLGSVIGNPAENFAGYTGSKSYVVWSGSIVRLPAAVADLDAPRGG